MPKETIVRPEVVEFKALIGSPDHPPTEASTQSRPGLSVGWNEIGWVQIQTEPAGAESTGDWHIVDLDRAAINRTIRALRKARDRAYGADA